VKHDKILSTESSLNGESLHNTVIENDEAHTCHSFNTG